MDLGKFNLKRLKASLAYRIKFIRGYHVHRKASVKKRKLVVLHKRADIQEYVLIRTFRNKVVIGENSQINPFTVIYGGSGVFIGKNVMIAPNCMIAAGNHNMSRIDVPMMQAGNVSKGPITIEDGVWIGANSVITDNVTIGHNSVVAAGSVVTKNVDPYSIVAGSPARIIKSRI